MGFRYFRVGIPWAAVQTKPNPDPKTWEWGYPDDMVSRLRDVGATLLVGPGGVPDWFADPRWSQGKLDPWLNYCGELQHRYKFELINLDVETTIARWWPSLDPVEYAEGLLIPTAKLLRPNGVKIVAPGTTLRPERNSTYEDALSHFKIIVESAMKKDRANLEYIDHLSFHVYPGSGDHGSDVITYIKRFLRDIANEWTWFRSDKRRLWVTETGFGGPGISDQEQLSYFTELMPWFASETDGDPHWIENVFVYHGFGSASGILDYTGPQQFETFAKPAGIYLSELVKEAQS